MSSKSESLPSLLLVLLFGSIFALAPFSSSADASGMESAGYNPMYDAIDHAEEALKALRENKKDEATKHAEKAVNTARSRSGGPSSKMSPEQTTQLEGGAASLETALAEAKKSKGHVKEEDVVKALVEWFGEKCKGGHGDGCPLNGDGSCQSPGLQPCNRFQTWKKCTNFSGACYCM